MGYIKPGRCVFTQRPGDFWECVKVMCVMKKKHKCIVGMVIIVLSVVFALALPACASDASNIFTVAIDPGHQARGNSQREPIGPGATEYKAKVAAGTRGAYTGIPEYQLVLDVSLQLRDELTTRGFNVFMIRETHDVNISNRERAIMATTAGADIFVRVHANGSSNSNARGIMTLSPSRNNPFIPDLYTQSRALSDHILVSMVSATGARNLGVLENDTMTGTNWSTVPVTIVELGFMTNPAEDRLMQTEEYQQKLVAGMANGIEAFFAESFARDRQ